MNKISDPPFLPDREVLHPGNPDRVAETLSCFIRWLDHYGEESFDFQSYYAGAIGRWAKSFYYGHPGYGKLAVLPMVASEAFFPAARRFFWHKQRFPIADSHFAMGFAFLFEATGEEKHYQRALHFLDILEKTRCPDFDRFCWGYPYEWVTKKGTVGKNTPLITSTPYGFEAFYSIYRIDGNKRWLEIMHSIAEHAFRDIKDTEVSPGVASSSYTPYDEGGVVNASAYRAFLLTSAADVFSDEKYWKVAEGNLNYLIESQRSDGSWFYSTDGYNDFIDHYHTCFVLKALAKIVGIRNHAPALRALEKGADYYLKDLLDSEGLPKSFSIKPRMVLYRNELYDYAESLNLCLLMRHRDTRFEKVLHGVLEDVLTRWRKKTGSFRSRKLIFGWDNVPMHRWGQAQIFRNLCLFVKQEKLGEKET